jgi:hypothetical protein
MSGASSGKFMMTESINLQMQMFTELRTSNPVRSREIFTKGENMVALAANGELRKLRELVWSMEKPDILFYFVIKVTASKTNR